MIPIIRKNENSDNASCKIGEQESERSNLRPCDQTHEKRYTKVSSAHPFASREKDLDIEKGEYPECSERGIDEGDIEQFVSEGEEVPENRGGYSAQRDDEEEDEQDDIRRNEHLVRDLHEEDIVEHEHDRHKRDHEEKPEFHYLRMRSGKEQSRVYEFVPGEEEKEPGGEFQERVHGGDSLPAEPTFSSEEEIGKYREEVERSERVSALRTMAPTRRNPALSGPYPPDKH